MVAGQDKGLRRRRIGSRCRMQEMTVGVLGRWWIQLAPWLAIVMLGILLACGGEATTLTPVATVSPALAITPTATPKATALPSPIPAARSPTATPSPTFASATLPQSAALELEVTSPAQDTVATSPFIAVAGLTSPDATVSVNGILATPDAQGRFSVEVPLSLGDNPLSIEIIATSIAGEQRSVVRTVIFVP